MTETAKKPNIFLKLGKFFREVRGEMKKVVWPTLHQTVNNTGIVIAAILLVGVFLAIVDLIFGILVRGAITLDFAKAFSDAFRFGQQL